MLIITFLLALVQAGIQFIHRFFQKELPCIGKAILVTGGGSGIGKQICEDLLEKGCVVYAADRTMSLLEAGWESYDLKALPHKSSKLIFLEMDVTNQEQVQQAAKTVENSGTGLYAIINAAGVGIAPSYPLAVIQGVVEVDVDKFIQPVMDINILGTMRVNNAFFRLIWVSKGVILNIGSIMGRTCTAGLGAYGISKKAVVGYSDTMRRELAPYGIRVGCIAPGWIATPMAMPVFHPDYVKWPKDYTQTKLTKGRGDEGQWPKISGDWDSLPTPQDVSRIITRQVFLPNIPAHTFIDKPYMVLFHHLMEIIPSDWSDAIFNLLREKVSSVSANVH